MRENVRSYLNSAILGIFLLFGGCLSLPEFSEIPKIEIESISFIENPDGVDTLALAINFQDGDGNLGLEANGETNHPFNKNYFFAWFPEITDAVKFSYIERSSSASDVSVHFETQAERDNFIINVLNCDPSNCNEFDERSYPGDPYVLILNSLRVGSNVMAKFRDDAINFSDRSSIPELDTLPPFQDPYSCLNWLVQENDTLFYEPNIQHNNMIVEFFVQNPNTLVFEPFQWETLFSYPQCNTNYHGRFQKLLLDDRAKPLEGTIRYSMTSIGFKNLFTIRRLKLRVHIYDRALNKSNVVETQSFTLQDITK